MPYEPPSQGFRIFVVFWLTQSVSVVGTYLTYFALVIWLTQSVYPDPGQQAQLTWAITALGLAFSIPPTVGSPLVGAFTDRHDRKRTMMAMGFLGGLVNLVLAVLLLSGGRRLWAVLALQAVASTLAALHNAAFDASCYMLVPEKQLPRANGMMQTTWALAAVLAPALAAGIISLARPPHGAPLAAAIAAAGSFLAAAALLFLFVPSPVRTDLRTAALSSGAGPGGKSFWADVVEGAVYIWRRRPLFWLLMVLAVVNLLTGPVTLLTPLLVKYRLAADWTARGFTYEAALALVSSAVALGGVAGGILVSGWGGLRRRRVWGVLLSFVPAGLAQTVFGLSPALYLTAAAGFALSVATPIANAHSQAIWQTQTPPELQGRVFSVRRFISQFTYPIGMAVAGASAARFGAAAFLAVTGVATSLFCLAAAASPVLLRVEDKAGLDALAETAAKRPSRGGAAGRKGEARAKAAKETTVGRR